MKHFYLKNSTIHFAFSLKDLGEESLLNTVHKFVAILGSIPSRMIVDRYLKLKSEDCILYSEECVDFKIHKEMSQICVYFHGRRIAHAF